MTKSKCQIKLKAQNPKLFFFFGIEENINSNSQASCQNFWHFFFFVEFTLVIFLTSELFLYPVYVSFLQSPILC